MTFRTSPPCAKCQKGHRSPDTRGFKPRAALPSAWRPGLDHPRGNAQNGIPHTSPHPVGSLPCRAGMVTLPASRRPPVSGRGCVLQSKACTDRSSTALQETPRSPRVAVATQLPASDAFGIAPATVASVPCGTVSFASFSFTGTLSKHSAHAA